MQDVNATEFIIGTFKKELKNRFLCEVLITDVPTICYVPSSCHLGNFLDLEGKKVLLVPTQSSSARTQYTLFAVPYKRNFIILNSSMANRAMASAINRRQFSYLGKRQNPIKEHTVDGYKTDIFLPKSNTIIEVKSIISLDSVAAFPTVYSERAINQLKKINDLLAKGFKSYYIIVSLNPYVKSIQVDSNSYLYEEMIKCMNSGLSVRAYTSRLRNGKPQIDKQIPVIF